MTQSPTLTRRQLLAGSLAFAGAGRLRALAAQTPTPLDFTGRTGAEFQALLDRAPPGAVIDCKQPAPMVVSDSLVVRKPLTLRGLKANLPPKLGRVPVLVVEAKNVALTDIEMHGNYDSVGPDDRAPFIWIKRGDFRVERCRFFDGTKDGLMIAPEDDTEDIVGGTIREIEGFRMGRDLVSISGGGKGLRVRRVTVENVRLVRGYRRGAVEVSDGTDEITARHIYAEDAVYAFDVQDHRGPTAPNTRVTLEDATAVRCKHILRTANSPQYKHADLTIRNFTGHDCEYPIEVKNTTRVRIDGLVITGASAADAVPIDLTNNHEVIVRNAAITGLRQGSPQVRAVDCSNLRIEALTLDGRPVKEPKITTTPAGKPKEKKS
jgi:hypothetical protein